MVGTPRVEALDCLRAVRQGRDLRELRCRLALLTPSLVRVPRRYPVREQQPQWVLSPPERKRLSLDRDTVDESDMPHAFRRNWPRKKARAERAYRHAERARIVASDLDGATRRVEVRKRRPMTLRESIGERLSRRQASQEEAGKRGHGDRPQIPRSSTGTCGTVVPPVPPSPQRDDVAHALKRLARLHTEGKLGTGAYEDAKRRLLAIED
jgi:hypothetical protein